MLTDSVGQYEVFPATHGTIRQLRCLLDLGAISMAILSNRRNLVVCAVWLLSGCARTTVIGESRLPVDATHERKWSPQQVKLSAQWNLPFDVVVNSDNCPKPGTNRTSRVGFDSYDLALRKYLRANRSDQEASLLIEASFGAPLLVTIEPTNVSEDQEERCAASCEMTIVSARTNLWSSMMEELERQQGGEAIIDDDEHQAAALANVHMEVDETRVALDVTLAVRILAIWKEVLSRTAYPRERLDGPNGVRVGYGSSDGTRYEFSNSDMSGETHSPSEGSLMALFVELGTKLVAARNGTNKAFWSDVTQTVSRLEERLRKREACEILVPAKR